MRTTMLYVLLLISLMAVFSTPGRTDEKDLEWRTGKPLNVTVHGNVKFAVKGGDLFLLDDDGKEHRLTLEKKTAKAGP